VLTPRVGSPLSGIGEPFFSPQPVPILRLGAQAPFVMEGYDGEPTVPAVSWPTSAAALRVFLLDPSGVQRGLNVWAVFQVIQVGIGTLQERLITKDDTLPAPSDLWKVLFDILSNCCAVVVNPRLQSFQEFPQSVDLRLRCSCHSHSHRYPLSKLIRPLIRLHDPRPQPAEYPSHGSSPPASPQRTPGKCRPWSACRPAAAFRR